MSYFDFNDYWFACIKTNRYPGSDRTVISRCVTWRSGLGWVHPSVLVHDFSEIGVILLMFLAGLESDLSLLKKIL